MLKKKHKNRLPRRVQHYGMRLPVMDGTALPSPPKMQEGAFQLGLLRFCHSSVKKCYGCGQLLKMKGGDGQWHIPSAPNDLVIITATRRTYWQNGEQKRGHLGNVYFHCRVECVRAMQAAFLPFLVVIPSVLRTHLMPAHRQHLAQELQILVSLTAGSKVEGLKYPSKIGGFSLCHQSSY